MNLNDKKEVGKKWVRSMTHWKTHIRRLNPGWFWVFVLFCLQKLGFSQLLHWTYLAVSKIVAQVQLEFLCKFLWVVYSTCASRLGTLTPMPCCLWSFTVLRLCKNLLRLLTWSACWATFMKWLLAIDMNFEILSLKWN